MDGPIKSSKPMDLIYSDAYPPSHSKLEMCAPIHTQLLETKFWDSPEKLLKFVYYRRLQPTDLDQLQQLHKEWFPIDYGMQFHFLACYGYLESIVAVIPSRYLTKEDDVLQDSRTREIVNGNSNGTLETPRRNCYPRQMNEVSRVSTFESSNPPPLLELPFDSQIRDIPSPGISENTNDNKKLHKYQPEDDLIVGAIIFSNKPSTFDFRILESSIFGNFWISKYFRTQPKLSPAHHEISFFDEEDSQQTIDHNIELCFAANEKVFDDHEKIKKENGSKLIYIHTLGTASKFRGLGLGKTLVNSLISRIGTIKPYPEAICLHVIDYNQTAIWFYKSLGFIKVSILPDYYYLDVVYNAYVFAYYTNSFDENNKKIYTLNYNFLYDCIHNIKLTFKNLLISLRQFFC